MLSLVPRPHHVREERVWGHNQESAPMSPQPFPRMRGGVWGQDYIMLDT